MYDRGCCSALYTGMPSSRSTFGERIVTSECSKSGCALKRCGKRRRITSSNFSEYAAGMEYQTFGSPVHKTRRQSNAHPYGK